MTDIIHTNLDDGHRLRELILGGSWVCFVMDRQIAKYFSVFRHCSVGPLRYFLIERLGGRLLRAISVLFGSFWLLD